MTDVLAVCAHPDDESLGCGGALRMHAHSGAAVRAIFLTSGEGGGHGLGPVETARLREEEARAATAVLGVAEPEFWREPDGSLAVRPDLVQRLGAVFRTHRPETIYVTHPDDDHPDHQAAARLVMNAVRNADVEARVLFTEIWTPLQSFTEVVDISEHMETKLVAVRKHATQCAVMDFPAAVAGLNRYRGEMHSWPGGSYAEVFAEWCP